MAEVCSLSRPVTFKPVSAPLQSGLRFLHLPLPASLSASLAVGLPRLRQRYGLTLFRMGDKSGLGPAFSPTAVSSTIPETVAEIPSRVPFGRSLVSAFGSLMVTAFNGGSLSLAIPPSLSPLGACARAGLLIPRGFGFPITGGVPFVSGASHEVIARLARPDRLLLVEQQVPLLVVSSRNNHPTSFSGHTQSSISGAVSMVSSLIHNCSSMILLA